MVPSPWTVWASPRSRSSLATRRAVVLAMRKSWASLRLAGHQVADAEPAQIYVLLHDVRDLRIQGHGPIAIEHTD